MEKRYTAVERDALLAGLAAALELLPKEHPARVPVLECQVLVLRGDLLKDYVPLTEGERWQKLMNAKDALEAAVLKLKGH